MSKTDRGPGQGHQGGTTSLLVPGTSCQISVSLQPNVLSGPASHMPIENTSPQCYRDESPHNHSERERPPSRGYNERPPSHGHSKRPPSTGHSKRPPSHGHSKRPPSPGHSKRPPSHGYNGRPPSHGYNERPPSHGYNERPPSHGYNERPPSHGYNERPPFHGYNERPPSHGYNERPPSHGYSERPPSHGYNERPPSHGYNERPPLHGYNERPPSHGYNERPPSHGYNERPPSHGYNERPPSHGYNERPPSHGYNERPPSHGYNERPPSHGYNERPPSHGYNERPPPHGYNERPPSHGYNERPPPYGYNERPPSHGYNERPPLHGYIERPPSRERPPPYNWSERLPSVEASDHNPLHSENCPPPPYESYCVTENVVLPPSQVSSTYTRGQNKKHVKRDAANTMKSASKNIKNKCEVKNKEKVTNVFVEVKKCFSQKTDLHKWLKSVMKDIRFKLIWDTVEMNASLTKCKFEILSEADVKRLIEMIKTTELCKDISIINYVSRMTNNNSAERSTKLLKSSDQQKPPSSLSYGLSPDCKNLQTKDKERKCLPSPSSRVKKDEELGPASWKKIKVSLNISTDAINSGEGLKSIILRNMDKSKSKIAFIESSILYTNQFALCDFILSAESKQLAKAVAKCLVQSMRKELKTEVSSKIAGIDEEQLLQSKNEVERNSLRAEATLRNWAQQDNPVENAPNAQMAELDKAGDCLTDTTSRPQLPKNMDTTSVPQPVPTIVYVKVAKSFQQKQDVAKWLEKALENCSFQVLVSSIEISSSETTCEIEVSSKAAAMRLVKMVNTNTRACVKIICSIKAIKVKDNDPNTQLNAQKIAKVLTDIKIKYESTLSKHEEKINSYQRLLDAMKNGKENEADENQATMDKITELKRQKTEFQELYETITVGIDGLNPLTATSTQELTHFQRTFGVECRRLDKALPIYARRKEIQNFVSSNQVSVILGETGSGKSTQMAQYILEAKIGAGQIVCTQPRKIAAISLAEYVAGEMTGAVGNLVGYKVGGKQKLNEQTKVVFTTDHSLLNECLIDRKLSNYSCIIVDEAHERSIYTDLLLGMIKKCLHERPDLKVIITSATIDPQIFIDFFNTKPELHISGRTFPVDIFYESMDESQAFENYETKAVEKAIQIHEGEDAGDILVFLTSSVEVMRCCEAFEKRMTGKKDFKCLPLHGQLSTDEQKKVFKHLSDGIRKIVFCTNCAETSVTIDGIRYVIDTGLAKEMKYDPKRNISHLDTHVISKSSADQRKGRAGRTSSGKCYRMYAEEDYNCMAAITDPEILRVHLGQAILKLSELGVDAMRYDFVQAPSKDAIQSALNAMIEIGALSPTVGITEVGRFLAKLPFDPKQGYLVFHGKQQNMLYDSVVLASLISNGSNLFYKGLSEAEEQAAARSKNQFSSDLGDTFTWLEVYKAWSLCPKKEQSKWCKEHSINYKVLNFTRQCIDDVAHILLKELNITMQRSFSEDRMVLETLSKIFFFANRSSICHYLGHSRAGYYAVSNEHQVHIHPSSPLASSNLLSEWVVYTELTKTSRNFIKGVTIVQLEWIMEAIEQGKLSLDVAQIKRRRIELVHREELGNSVFHALVGPRFSNLKVLEEKLSETGMMTVVLEADRGLGTVDIYSSTYISDTSLKILNEFKKDMLKRLESEEDEFDTKMATNEDDCNFRVVLGLGGSVKTTFWPGESNTVIIKKESKNTTVDDVRKKFSSFGDIKDCFKFKQPGPWGLVRYSTFLEAKAAVSGTCSDETGVAVLKAKGRCKPAGNLLVAKFSWCRRPVKGKGLAFISCPPLEVASLVGKSLYLNGRFCNIKMDKNEECLVCYDVGVTSEDEVRRQIMSLLQYSGEQNTIRVTFNREHRDVPSHKDLDAIKGYISRRLEVYLSKDDFSIELVMPNAKSVYQIAIVRFKHPSAGLNACTQLQGCLQIDDQPVVVSPKLKASLYVSKDVMKICKEHFDQMINDLTAYEKAEVTIRNSRGEDFLIDITSSKAEYIIEARELFQSELEGVVIDCGLNSMAKCLLKPQGLDMIRKVEKSCSILIVVDRRHEKMRIFGAEEHVSKAMIEINEYLDKLLEGKQEIVSLKGYGKPPGLMKALMLKHGVHLDGFLQEFGINDVNVNFKKQELTLIGPQTAVAKALSSISEVVNSLISSGLRCDHQEMPDCVACMSPVSGVSDLHRMEVCGHSYCMVCLQTQVSISVQEKRFPICCVEATCQMPFCWRDFQFFLSQKWVEAEKLAYMALNAFVEQNKMIYSFCPTANCSVIYKVSNDPKGCKLECPSCFTTVCSSCCSFFHQGLTCKFAADLAISKEELGPWIQTNPEKNKFCPGCGTPVEKIEGCNKMQCIGCKTYFCWVCLETFESEQTCYAHLAKVHGSFS